MKIKTWLLLSYFIVMVLPLIAAYCLFIWINSFNNDQKVEEHVQVMNELEHIKQTLDNPAIYTPDAAMTEVEKLATQERALTLLNKHGIVLYTSNPSLSSYNGLSKKNMYQDLYELKQGYRSYTYKQPVFDHNDLIGFFQIEISRDSWIQGVGYRSYFILGLFIVTFTLIYLTVIRLVNKKLNLRLTGLMKDMTAFASGQPIDERKTNHDEIGKLTEHFYQMKRRIESSRKIIEKEQEAKEYLIASVSHDLKTPLTSIKAYTESLNHPNLSERERMEYQQVILEKSAFMQDMLEDLLTYTLLQSQTHDLELVEVEGDEFFDMLVSGYDALCATKGIKLETFVDVAGLYNVNPKQMMRVADNLVSNGVQHTESGNRMWIAAFSNQKELPEWLFDFIPENKFSENHASAYFLVQNEGKGIPEDKLAYVFAPLYQADAARSKRDKHGSGLGLSITKQIIEKHGGEVSLFSKENRGTCIICQLPKTDEGEIS